MSSQSVYSSPFPPYAVPQDVSISQLLLNLNPDDVSPDTIIYSDFSNPSNTLSFNGIRKLAAQGAAGLREIVGLREGDVACVYAHNSVSWALLAHSIMWAGACSCGINPLATSYELVHYFETAKPKLVAVDETMLGNVEEALKVIKLPIPPKVLVLQGHSTRRTNTGLPQFPRDFVSDTRKPTAPYDLTGKDNSKVPAAICFSSGTSGKPKGVILSHNNLIAYLLAGRASSPFLNSSRSREVFFPSFAHIYGLVSAVLQPAYVGCYLVVMSEFDFLPYLRRCSEIRATVLRLVPSTAIRMTKDPATRNLNLKSVQTVMCSSASLATETVQELQKILNPEAKIVNGYGMSEASITMLRESQSHRAGSVGKPISGVTIRVVDDHMEDVAPGKDGQCIVKSPTVFMCYKDNPEETAASFHGGWLLTGDIVRVDEDGYFWITGRKKELIKYKGNQIAPAELDAILLSHPLVTDAAVVGIPTKEKDSEVPLGCVSLASSVEARDIEKVLEQIKKFVDAKVAPYKRLRGGLFHVEVLPKTSTGKVMRRTLPEIVAGKMKVANAAKL